MIIYRGDFRYFLRTYVRTLIGQLIAHLIHSVDRGNGFYCLQPLLASALDGNKKELLQCLCGIVMYPGTNVPCKHSNTNKLVFRNEFV